MTKRLEEIKKRALLLSSPNNPCCAVGEECNRQLHEDLKLVFTLLESAQKVIQKLYDWGVRDGVYEYDQSELMEGNDDPFEQARDWLRGGE